MSNVDSIEWILLLILGNHEVKGLSCYTCTKESGDKCHYARSSEGGEEEDTSWFGDKTPCDETATHCMTARTRMKN